MNKTLFLLLLICGLILSALILRNGQALLLAMPFLAYLVVGAIQAPTRMKLSARRFMDKASAVAQEPVEARLVVTNEGERLVNLYLADFHFPGLTPLSGGTYRRSSLAPGEQAELEYIFSAPRGLYSWKSIQAIASDPFGLFELKQDIPASGELVVRPASLKVSRLSLQPRSTLHAPGPVAIPLSGSSTDFLGVREYQVGDPLRRLNWHLAARHPRRLFTNEYEREEVADYGLILDARRIIHAGSVEEALFESSVQAVLSLSEAFLKAGNRVSLLVFGESMASLFPGYGKKQLNRIVRTLARARLGSKLSLGYLEYFPTRLFPSRSVLVVFSPVGNHDQETYARLRSFGYDILLVSPDPVDYIRQKLPRTEIDSLAARAARLERILQLEEIMRLGVHVIDWQVDQPLETILQGAAAHFSRRRRN